MQSSKSGFPFFGWNWTKKRKVQQDSAKSCDAGSSCYTLFVKDVALRPHSQICKIWKGEKKVFSSLFHRWGYWCREIKWHAQDNIRIARKWIHISWMPI